MGELAHMNRVGDMDGDVGSRYGCGVGDMKVAFEMGVGTNEGGDLEIFIIILSIQTISKWLLSKGIQNFPHSFLAEMKGFSGGPMFIYTCIFMSFRSFQSKV